MPYQNSMQGFSRFPSSSKPVTMEDVEARRKMLQDLGLQDSALGDLNRFQSDIIGQRDELKDEMKSQLRGYAKQAIGMSM